jgi:hypothetical protein
MVTRVAYLDGAWFPCTIQLNHNLPQQHSGCYVDPEDLDRRGLTKNKETGMCVLCTAIPASLSLGVVAEAKQNEARREALANGETPPRRRPYWAVSLGAMIIVVTVSTLYHVQGGG